MYGKIREVCTYCFEAREQTPPNRRSVASRWLTPSAVSHAVHDELGHGGEQRVAHEGQSLLHSIALLPQRRTADRRNSDVYVCVAEFVQMIGSK